MTQCLARFAKPPLYTHVHFFRHPGSPANLFQNTRGSGVLDPSHPGTQTPLRTFPRTANEYFRLKAFPNALLSSNLDSTGSPSWPQVDSWTNRVGRATASRTELTSEQNPVPREGGKSGTIPQPLEFVSPAISMPHPKKSIPMNLYFSVGKARTHKHAVIRRGLRTRFREAINLVVTRGARLKKTESNIKELYFDHEEVRVRGNKWILTDWAYICYPNPKLYLTPYSELTQMVRKSLEEIWDAGMHLETLWADQERRRQLRVSMVNDAYNEGKYSRARS